MDPATKKVWGIPELGEKVITFLDPLSVLHLAQSKVMDKETLQKSLTFKAWGELIKRCTVSESDRAEDNLRRIAEGLNFEKDWFPEIKENVKVLVRILHFVKLDELSPYLLALLDLICESSVYGGPVEMICPRRPEHHSITKDAFLLLEEVEAAFGTTEQSLKSVVTDWPCGNLPSAIISRMSRQKSEASIRLLHVGINDKSSAEAFITFLQTQVFSVENLDLRRAELEEESWQALAGALRGKPEMLESWVYISRQNIAAAGKSIIKDIWDATSRGIVVYSMYYGSCQSVLKFRFDWENAWPKLEKLSDMTEDEFDDDCELLWRVDRDEGAEVGGEDAEVEGEDIEGEEEDGEEEGSEGEGQLGGCPG